MSVELRPWTIRVLDREWHSADQRTLTLIAVADEYGPADQWQAISPWNGPVALAAWLTVLFVGETANIDAARLLVHTMAPAEFIGCLTEPAPPPAAAAPDGPPPDEPPGDPVPAAPTPPSPLAAVPA